MNFGNIPPVVKNLLIINGLFFLATIMFADQVDLTNLLGLHHPSSSLFMVHQFVTHFFMHSSGSFGHIFFNMFALWMFGRVLEGVWGSKRFLIYYVVTALGAAGIYTLYISFGLNAMENLIADMRTIGDPALFKQFVNDYMPMENLVQSYTDQVRLTASEWIKNPDNEFLKEQAVALSQSFLEMKRDVPMIGASGAVFGVLLAFGMLFPNTELMLLFPPIPIKAKWFVLIYGAIELFMGFNANPADNVAHFAHLGGMLSGLMFAMIYKTLNRRI